MRKTWPLIAATLLSAPAHAEWLEASSKHFVVYSDDTPAKLKTYTERLEKFDKAMRVLRKVKPIERSQSSRVNVYIVDSMADLQKLYGAGGRNVGGFYTPRAGGPVAFVPRKTDDPSLSAQQIFLHEYTHHFMFNDWPTAVYPKWFTEGFAEFHSTAIFGDDGSVTFGAPPLSRTYGVDRANALPASRMLRADPGKLDNLANYVLYSRGWLMMHYITFSPERRAKLADYIAAINAGKPADEATKVFGNLDALDHELDVYVRRPTFQSARFTSDELPIGPVAVRALTAAEAAMMPVRVASERGVNATTALRILTLARRLAAPYPNDAAAQNVLAEAEYDAASLMKDKGGSADFTPAMAAVDRALAADPKSLHAHQYKGMVLQAIAEQAKATDAATWLQVRRAYIAANRIDPENPRPLILYYQSYRAAKQPAPEAAEGGLLYAYALAPFDLELRGQAGKVLLRQNKIPLAREALLPVAYSAEAGPISEKLRAVITAMDANDAPGALAQLQKIEDEAEAEAKKARAKG